MGGPRKALPDPMSEAPTGLMKRQAPRTLQEGEVCSPTIADVSLPGSMDLVPHGDSAMLVRMTSLSHEQ